jgi:hypothetical protein
MLLKKTGDEPGLYLRNGSPTIDRIFRDTRWANRAWMKAIRKLEGVFSRKDPTYFPWSGKYRVIGIPLKYIPTDLEIDPGF